jgi:putative transposase
VKRIPPSAIGLNENQAQYIRSFVPGGTFFFTVTLLEHRRKLLTGHFDNPRASFMAARQPRPFTVEASVILPDPVRRLEIK